MVEQIDSGLVCDSRRKTVTRHLVGARKATLKAYQGSEDGPHCRCVLHLLDEAGAILAGERDEEVAGWGAEIDLLGTPEDIDRIEAEFATESAEPAPDVDGLVMPEAHAEAEREAFDALTDDTIFGEPPIEVKALEAVGFVETSPAVVVPVKPLTIEAFEALSWNDARAVAADLDLEYSNRESLNAAYAAHLEG